MDLGASEEEKSILIYGVKEVTSGFLGSSWSRKRRGSQRVRQKGNQLKGKEEK